MLKHMAATNLKPVIDKAFAFEELEEGYEYFGRQKHVGRVIIKIA